ncbi:MamK family actin-like protein [Magnetospirillum sp. UT-4]|uniref:MamK family actin-like protein n=1 Tax=Magnetospirillum sp. UT-4 TaxID=2681467 RepID=UPI001385AFA1|nr:MamK family actin-like protein [Magnetospirillum sp. UT-4]CAA7622266.1 The actin-like protein MamK involved in magnetosomes alignments [Magnetospirillum sp. UT-4]
MSQGEDRGQAKQRLFLGIDLGTSHTAVMSSRGKKFLLKSVVGYPKDVIGLKLLGRPYVVGDEAFDMRSYLDLRYPLQDGVLSEISERDVEVARHLLTHLVRTAEPEEGEDICAVIGVPARASAANKALLLKMAQEVVHTAMVVSEPFMVAYGLEKLVNAIVVDIGAGTTDICALKGTVPGPEDQVTLTKAGNYVDERLQNAILERHPELQMNLNVACAVKERFSFVGPAPEASVYEFRAAGKPVQRDVTDAVRIACEALMPDILESIETLLQSFQPECQAVALRNIIVAGGGSRIRGIAGYVQEKLRPYGVAEVTCVKDPTFDGCRGALRLAEELPPQYWRQLGDVTGS